MKIYKERLVTMKTIFLTASVAIAATLMAAEVPVKAQIKPVSPEFKNRREEIIMTKHGGLIRRVGTGEGHISFISVNNAVSEDKLKELASRYGEQLRMDIEVSCRDDFSIANAHQAVEQTRGAIAIIYVKDETLPIFLMNVDSRWGVVNVANFGDRFDTRLAKMTVRAIPDVSGVGKQLFYNSNFKPINTVEDIDSLKTEDIPRTVVMGVHEHLAPLGVKPYKLNTYQKACEEGWAPLPKNKYQQAIWDKVHSLPTEPLKIAPEATKQK